MSLEAQRGQQSLEQSYSRDKEKKEEKIEKEKIFEYGSKRLTLIFDPQKSEATSHIENIKSKKYRESGETSYLYKVVKDYLQKIANESGNEIVYKLITQNKKMIAWAQSAGNEIFEWENPNIRIKGSRSRIFETTIFPEK